MQEHLWLSPNGWVHSCQGLVVESSGSMSLPDTWAHQVNTRSTPFTSTSVKSTLHSVNMARVKNHALDFIAVKNKERCEGFIGISSQFSSEDLPLVMTASIMLEAIFATTITTELAGESCKFPLESFLRHPQNCFLSRNEYSAVTQRIWLFGK